MAPTPVILTVRRHEITTRPRAPFNGLGSTLSGGQKQKGSVRSGPVRLGPVLTVGGSQLDDVRHFVDEGRMRREETRRHGDTDQPVTSQPYSGHEDRDHRKHAAAPGDEAFICSVSVGLGLGLGLGRARSVRSDARAVMLALGCREAARRSSR